MATGTDLSSTDSDRCIACREELAALARARTRLSVPLGQLPRLRELAGGPGADLDGVLSVIEQARRRLPSREAAAIAELLADTDERWGRNLRERMTIAGAHVGVTSYHTFRDRKRPDGRSLYDQLLDVLANELLGEQPSVGPAAGAGSVPSIEAPSSVGDSSIVSRDEVDRVEEGWPESPSAGGIGRRRGALLTALVTVGLLSLVFVIVRWRTAPESAEFPNLRVVVDGRAYSFGQPVEGCDIPLGGTMNPAGVSQEFVDAVVAAVDDAGGVEAVGCPLHAFDLFEGLMLQHYSGGTGPEGWIVGVPDEDRAFFFDDALVTTYQYSLDGTLVDLGGLPIGNDSWQGHPAMWLSEGGVILAHEPGGPAFWVPGPAIPVWEAAGGPEGDLGLPMTRIGYRDGLPYQEFEGGHLVRGAETESDPLVVMRLVDAAERSSALGDLPAVEGKLVRSHDSTFWLIDEAGTRHWVPDDATRACLGGEANELESRIAGWVIAAFPSGDRASC